MVAKKKPAIKKLKLKRETIENLDAKSVSTKVKGGAPPRKAGTASCNTSCEQWGC